MTRLPSTHPPGEMSKAPLTATSVGLGPTISSSDLCSIDMALEAAELDKASRNEWDALRRGPG